MGGLRAQAGRAAAQWRAPGPGCRETSGWNTGPPPCRRASRYLWKFQRGAWPVCWASCWKNALACGPFTLLLANMGKRTPKVLSQNSAISLLLPVSCEKSLDGKPSTTRPLPWYLACRASSSLYCPVKPQKLAVLTTSSTLPLYWHSDWGFSSCSRRKGGCSVGGRAPALVAGCARAGAVGSSRAQARLMSRGRRVGFFIRQLHICLGQVRI